MNNYIILPVSHTHEINARLNPILSQEDSITYINHNITLLNAEHERPYTLKHLKQKAYVLQEKYNNAVIESKKKWVEYNHNLTMGSKILRELNKDKKNLEHAMDRYENYLICYRRKLCSKDIIFIYKALERFEEIICLVLGTIENDNLKADAVIQDILGKNLEIINNNKIVLEKAMLSQLKEGMTKGSVYADKEFNLNFKRFKAILKILSQSKNKENFLALQRFINVHQIRIIESEDVIETILVNEIYSHLKILGMKLRIKTKKMEYIDLEQIMRSEPLKAYLEIMPYINKKKQIINQGTNFWLFEKVLYLISLVFNIKSNTIRKQKLADWECAQKRIKKSGQILCFYLLESLSKVALETKFYRSMVISQQTLESVKKMILQYGNAKDFIEFKNILESLIEHHDDALLSPFDETKMFLERMYSDYIERMQDNKNMLNAVVGISQSVPKIP